MLVPCDVRGSTLYSILLFMESQTSQCRVKDALRVRRTGHSFIEKLMRNVAETAATYTARLPC